jgi:hypothetical protein
VVRADQAAPDLPGPGREVRPNHLFPAGRSSCSPHTQEPGSAGRPVGSPCWLFGRAAFPSILRLIAAESFLSISTPVLGPRGSATGRGTDIERLLNDGLEEGYRLAAEARAVLVSGRQNALAIDGLASMTFWTLLLILFMGPYAGSFPDAITAVLADTAVAALVGVPLVLWTHRSYRARIDEQERWMRRLRQGMDPGSEEGSSFDLLMEASQQVPSWINIRNKGSYGRHPFLSTAAFIGGASALGLLYDMISSQAGDQVLAIALMTLAFLALCLVSLYIIRSENERERKETVRRWQERLEESRKALDEILGGL